MPNSADNIVTKTRYDSLGRVVETRGPGSTGTDAGTELTVYYTAGTNTDDAACGNAPQWAGLVCVTRTGETSPTLPVVRTTGYSMLLAPTTVTETSGTVTRTSTTTYLADGRTDTTTLATSGLTGFTAVDTSAVLYDSATGLPTATVTYDTNNVETGRVSTTSDLWGRNVDYLASNGDAAHNTYDASTGRLASTYDGLHTITYGYDGIDAAGNAEHRGLGTSMTVTGVGTFTAAFDAHGNMTMQTMPGGITQENEYALTGEPLSLSYTTTDVNGDPVPLMGWTQVSDLYGRVAQETTPSAGQAPDLVGQYNRAYTYDRAGRLTQVQDRTAVPGADLVDDPNLGTVTPCVTRTYTFDTHGNRLARSTATSGTDGVCTTTGGFTDAWTYDGRDRLLTGANATGSYVYDALGRQTTIPAIDTPMGAAAGNLAIGYFDNDLVHTLAQNGTTTTFTLDPLQRRLAATTVSGTGTTTQTRHYADATDNPAWVTSFDGTTTHTSWYGSSLGGDLGITVTDGATSIQLADIHGDIALPVALDSTGQIAGFGGFSDFDEYGRPLTGTATPDTGTVQYGWLGGKERATDAATGLLLLGVRLYNPVTGSFTSPDPVAGGNTTAYAYPQDPINKYDTSGKSWWTKVKSGAKRALANRAVRMLVTGLAVAAICTGTAGVGCAVVAGAVIGAGLSVANYRANTATRSTRGYLKAAGVGALEGAAAGYIGRYTRISSNAGTWRVSWGQTRSYGVLRGNGPRFNVHISRRYGGINHWGRGYYRAWWGK